MSLCLLLLLGRPRVLKTVTVPAGTTLAWKCPATTTKLENLTGKGGVGKPASSFYRHFHYITTRFIPNVGNPAWGHTNLAGVVENFSSTPPATYTNNRIDYDWGYSIDYNEFTGTDLVNVPATTGPSTTGFGKTFPGGTGGAASSQQFPNVAVVPGTTYNLTVAAGGSLSFTYYE